MKYNILSTQQKWYIIHRVEAAENKERELALLGIPKTTYYNWLRNGCEAKKKTPHRIWNKTPQEIEEKIKSYRVSGDPFKNSPARIIEQLEQHDGYLLTESGAKSVLKRQKLNNLLKPKKRRYYIHPKAEKFLQVVSVDDDEFLRAKPHDTYVLNFTDEASYFALESRVLGHRPRGYNIIAGLKEIYRNYGRYPAKIRLDNARAHYARKVQKFCERHGITLEYITKGCPEENWPVESWHRNLNQDLIYRNGFETIREWQTAVDQYRYFHNYQKRLRSDAIGRTPAEIAFAFTSPLTQQRLKLKLLRKHKGQTAVQKYFPISQKSKELNIPYIMPKSEYQMCVS